MYTAAKWKQNIEDPLLDFARTVYRKYVFTQFRSSANIVPFAAEAVCHSRAMRGSQELEPLCAVSRSASVQLSKPSPPGPSNAPSLFGDDAYDDGEVEADKEDFMVDYFASEGDTNINVNNTSANINTNASAHANINTSTNTSSNMNIDMSTGANVNTGVVFNPSDHGRHQEMGVTGEESAVNGWDNGEELSPEERTYLLTLGSDTERTRLMNIRLRDREALADGLINQIPSIIPKSSAPPLKKKAAAASKASNAKGKSKAVAKANKTGGQNEAERSAEPRRSDRNLKGKISSMSGSETPIATETTELAVSIAPSAGPDGGAVPGWMDELLLPLTVLGEGPLWTSLLVKWVDFERQLGFPKGRVSSHFYHPPPAESLPVMQSKAYMLSATNRPAPIGIWIHNGRHWADLPIIGPGIIEDYSTSWWLWWKSLQPTWRAETLSRDFRGVGDYDWDELRKGTQNGYFVLILSLGLWLRGLQNKGEKGRWPCGDAMREVEWVLDQMIASGQVLSMSLGKRPLDDESRGAPASKRGKKTKLA